MQVPDPGLDHVKDLKIQCSDVFFFESQLRSDHFGSLHNLENLQINYCKLRSLPPRTFVGLRSLKHLGKIEKCALIKYDWFSSYFLGCISCLVRPKLA